MIYRLYRAVELTLSIWNIYTMPRGWEPFDSIDLKTAWAVSRGIWLEGVR
jgi:hypothetical protein